MGGMMGEFRTPPVSVEIDRLTRRIGGATILDSLSLHVAQGEFMVILGESGCGKTTLLRLIAGFDAPDGGTIQLGDMLVSGAGEQVPPEKRNLGIVFQSYALWPHMSVAENVGFGLDLAGLSRSAQGARIAQALAQVGLSGLAARRPADLSGGQRQRVALARCLAKAPGLVLLDEPLANLDPGLRQSVRQEFVAMRRALGSTFLYVTHDQSEALALADRIALLNKGRLEQCGAPQTLYRTPATAHVARFIGDGMLVPAVLLGPKEGAGFPVELGGQRLRVRATPGQAPGIVTLCLRAHDLALVPAGTPESLTAVAGDALYQGSYWRVSVRVPTLSDRLLDVETRQSPPEAGSAVGLQVLDGWVIPAEA
ncbi:MAG: ABC transporter ATP-binding protein [Elstera sp.]